MRAYVDSDIMIWHLRGNNNSLRLLHTIRDDNQFELWTGALQRAEVIFFMRPEEEADTLLFLSQFKTAPVDQETIDRAGQIYRKWHPSHGIDINDAILAATAMITGGCIYTLNVKHYPMPNIVVQQGWQQSS